MVNRFKLIIILLVVYQYGFTQDTIKVEPIEFGFPERPRIQHSLQDRYGLDSAQWPIWLRKKIGLRDMRLNTINAESLMLNDTLSLTLDRRIDYSTKQTDSGRPTYYQALYYQGNFIFARVDSMMEFYSMKEPLTEGILPLSGISNGKRVSLASLSSIRKELPESYDWRNSIPSWATDFFSDEEEIYLTVVQVSLTTHKDSLMLIYYKDRLVFTYQDHYNGK